MKKKSVSTSPVGEKQHKKALNQFSAKIQNNKPSHKTIHGKTYAQVQANHGLEPGVGLVEDGWADLIDELLINLKKQNFNPSWITQIKEKWGGLSIYFVTYPPADYFTIQELIDQAEEESLKICEWCGNPGSLRIEQWQKTLCDSCQQAQRTI